MRCPTCRSENAPHARFCGLCSAYLEGARPFGQAREATGSLVPRDLGDLIGDTFRVYSRNFWTFYFIALTAQVPLLLGQFVPGIPLLVIFLLIGVVLDILAAGAFALAVALQHVGRKASVGHCYKEAFQRLLSLVCSTLVFVIALFLSAVLSLLIVGLPLFFYIWVTWYFYSQAIMIEGKRGPRMALGRSHGLVKGSWWRVFGMGTGFVVLLVMLYIVAIIPGLILSTGTPIAGGILLAIAGSLVAPLGYIGTTLVYFDLRIRKENYTRQELASELGVEE